jgi:SAM-dependent methyltransferase
MQSKYFEEESYEWLERFERENFWYRIRNEILLSWINQYILKGSKFLEIGCGTGFVSQSIKENYDNDCADVSGEALSYCRNKNAAHNYYQIDLCDEDLGSRIDISQYAGIGLFDVIEHIEEDEKALRNINRLMAPDALLFMTVPANRELWSEWDEYTCHKRRYSKKDFVQLLNRSGFRIERMSFFMCILYPLVRISRVAAVEKRIKSSSPGDNIQKTIHYIIGEHSDLNRVLYSFFKIEVSLLNYTNLPFGVSIICVASKKN